MTKSARACWAEFGKRTLCIPLECAGGRGIIGGALWLTGGQEMFWQTTSDMGTALFRIGAILLMYPFLTILWVAKLRDGLRVSQDWKAVTPGAQAAAIAEAKSARQAVKQKRQTRKKE